MLKQQTQSKTLYRRSSIAGAIFGLALLFAPALVYVPALQLADVQSRVAAGCAQGEKANKDGSCSLPPLKNSDACPRGQCIIDRYIQPGVNLVAGMVGLAVTISFISAGIRYATSADSPQKVSEAKQRMVTSVFVLVGFFTFYAAMNYLIPGGLI
jgi:hypothetical protein